MTVPALTMRDQSTRLLEAKLNTTLQVIANATQKAKTKGCWWKLKFFEVVFMWNSWVEKKQNQDVVHKKTWRKKHKRDRLRWNLFRQRFQLSCPQADANASASGKSQRQAVAEVQAEANASYNATAYAEATYTAWPQVTHSHCFSVVNVSFEAYAEATDKATATYKAVWSGAAKEIIKGMTLNKKSRIPLVCLKKHLCL